MNRPNLLDMTKNIFENWNNDHADDVNSKKFSGSSPEDFAKNFLRGGNSASDQDFQFFFQNVWNRENAQQQETWAREDAATAYQRQQDLPNILRSNEFAQLISMGMSPAAALQALSGGSGAGGVGAVMPQTAQVLGAANGGDTASQYGNFVNNVVQDTISNANAIASNVGQIYLQNKGLRQQNEQFYAGLNQDAEQFNKRLAFEREQWENATYLQRGVYSAMSTIDYNEFISGYRSLANDGSIPADKLLSQEDVVKELARLAPKDDRAKSAYDAYQRGLKENDTFWTSAIDSQLENQARAVSTRVSNALAEQEVQYKRNLMHLNDVNCDVLVSVARKNNLESDILDGYSPAYVAYCNEVYKDKLWELQNGDYSPSVKYARISALKESTEYQYLRNLNERILEEATNMELSSEENEHLLHNYVLFNTFELNASHAYDPKAKHSSDYNFYRDAKPALQKQWYVIGNAPDVHL